jgi:hypothetical protein
MAKPLKFQIIERAKELIQDEDHWCRGYLGMDASKDLRSWCSDSSRVPTHE